MNQINPITQAMQQQGMPEQFAIGSPAYNAKYGLDKSGADYIAQFPGSSATPTAPQARPFSQQDPLSWGVPQRPAAFSPQQVLQPFLQQTSAAKANPIMQAMQQQSWPYFGSRSSRPPVPMPQPAAPTPGYGSAPRSSFGSRSFRR